MELGKVTISFMVGIAQLVSAPDCGSGGQGFESLYPPWICALHIWWLLMASSHDNSQHKLTNVMGYRQAVRHRTLTPAFDGSNPSSPVSSNHWKAFVNGILAQSVEHLTFNQGVPGSSPGCLS